MGTSYLRKLFTNTKIYLLLYFWHCCFLGFSMSARWWHELETVATQRARPVGEGITDVLSSGPMADSESVAYQEGQSWSSFLSFFREMSWGKNWVGHSLSVSGLELVYLQSSMGGSSAYKVESHCFRQQLEGPEGGTIGASFQTGNSGWTWADQPVEVRVKWKPRQVVNRICSHPRDGVTGTVTLRGGEGADLRNNTEATLTALGSWADVAGRKGKSWWRC